MNHCSNIEAEARSHVMESHYVKILCADDVPAILELENACWLPEIRASEETLRTRFAMGHISMGIFVGGHLVGLTSFSYTRFNPDDPSGLPETFKQFSSRPRHSDHNAAYVYNLNIHPDYRGELLTRKLIWTGIEQLREDNCVYMLGAGRCPSYNGSLGADIETIQPSHAFRKAIDDAMQSGTLPATSELIVDPVLRFYRRTLGCKFLKVAADFLPGDRPSGNFGVIFYKAL